MHLRHLFSDGIVATHYGPWQRVWPAFVFRRAWSEVPKSKTGTVQVDSPLLLISYTFFAGQGSGAILGKAEFSPPRTGA